MCRKHRLYGREWWRHLGIRSRMAVTQFLSTTAAPEGCYAGSYMVTSVFSKDPQPLLQDELERHAWRQGYQPGGIRVLCEK